ncbi:hypothetical protein [Vitiosangium sp. GDMCC 1.1324]|uniref:hypothetical protein n=1 Tax=Vitiosangium sp. (strain GDMCC 1.1324) TaxID=2138576 RepID=UPI000D36F854|nr:hypothetical protein [Vitiosangium sp. GDMCC 1.1324]PTL83547.1 hypothetical protein DAT35_08595 [Vitiosangium sp. GDMCC 1.1324]
MKYFVITESDDLVLAPDFARLLCAHWPQATVEPVSDPASSYALEFRIPMAHSHVDGSLNRAGSAIAFIGDLRDCAEFALWCRSIAPPSESLTLCDESMSGTLALESATTAADILQAFRYSPPST